MTELMVVIPHYGDDTLLERCIASLNDAGILSRQIVVVSQNPPMQNRLFTWAINHGIDMALARREDPNGECVIWLLNNDTVVQKDTHTQALRCFEEEGWERCGIVGTRCQALSEPDFIFWGGSKRCYPTGQHKSGRISLDQLKDRTEEEWVTFASAFINARVIREIGLLDKTLKHVCSDADYSFRARAAGWRCYYEPKSSILHAVGSSHHTADNNLKRIMGEDMERFYDKWIGNGLFKQLTEYKDREHLRRPGQ